MPHRRTYEARFWASMLEKTLLSRVLIIEIEFAHAGTVSSRSANPAHDSSVNA
jgi:hypothetical protein